MQELVTSTHHYSPMSRIKWVHYFVDLEKNDEQLHSKTDSL